MKKGYVYIMTNKHHTTLYVGITSNLEKRVQEHKGKTYPNSFTARYNCSKLVYYAVFNSITTAIQEEKRIKGGSRDRKEQLINSINPNWDDLAQDL